MTRRDPRFTPRIAKTSRQLRRRMLREAILADYARAGDDPQFMAEMAELEADFAGTLRDGLNDPDGTY